MADGCTGNFASISLCYVEKGMDKVGDAVSNAWGKAAEATGEVVGAGVEKVADSAIEKLSSSISEALGKAVSSLGTFWVNIKTPSLTDGEAQDAAGGAGTDSSGIDTVLGYVTWIALAVALLALFMLGARIALGLRRGEGIVSAGRIGIVLGAVVMISGATSIVAAMVPDAQGGGTVFFLQSSLWWYTGAAAIVSVIIGGVRMAWEQRAEPGLETVKSMLTLIVVGGSGVTIVSLLVTAADGFSSWVIDRSLDGGGFAENISALLSLSSSSPTPLPAMTIIVLGLIALIASCIQIALMIVRSGMLVILCGVLPLTASFTNTQTGKSWFTKCIGWLTAFIMYKPAAAIVYAAAFRLAGADAFSDDGTGLISAITGIILMVLALFAMPALMRFVTPMVAATAGGAAGMSMSGGQLGQIPTGSIRGSQLSGPGGGASGGGGSGAGASAASKGAGAGAGGAGAGAAGAGGAGAGAGAAGAGAAAGPIGLAAVAGIKAGKAVASGARHVAEAATGESAQGAGGSQSGSSPSLPSGSGPSGGAAAGGSGSGAAGGGGGSPSHRQEPRVPSGAHPGGARAPMTQGGGPSGGN